MLASDDSNVIRIRLIVRVVTYVANMLMDLIAILGRKRKGRGVTPASIEDASDALAKAGIGDGLISHTLVYDCRSGHQFDLWEVGRWGPDDACCIVLGRGATLGAAVHEFQRQQKPRTKPRW